MGRAECEIAPEEGEGAGGRLQLSTERRALRDPVSGRFLCPPPPASLIGADRLSCASQGLQGSPLGDPSLASLQPLTLFRGGVCSVPSAKGPPGAMERAAGPLRATFSSPVLESKAPGAPLDCAETDCGSPSPRGDGTGASHSAAELPARPEDGVLPTTPHLNQLLALGVLPASASSAFAAPGPPRESARWMLCVAGAKLKVSGEGARRTLVIGDTGEWGQGQSCGPEQQPCTRVLCVCVCDGPLTSLGNRLCSQL